MDKFSAMKSFVAVVQAGSFTAAAKTLAVPKSRVSQRVQDLETSLSARLLNRTTRVLSLTDDGKVYLQRCLQIINEVDEADRALHRRGEHAIGKLEVSCMSIVARTVLLPQLAEFRTRYPDVNLKLSVTDRLANLVEEGIDCAIRGGVLEDSSLICKHVRDVQFGLYASPSYLKQRKLIKHPQDLDQHTRIAVANQKSGAVEATLIQSGKKTFSWNAPPQLETDDDHAAMLACVGGYGVLVASDFAVRNEISSSGLVRILPNWSANSRPLYIIYPTRRFLSAKLRCFVDWVNDILLASG
jgi:LysR family transcriptional regulator, regulator for bpeEF and oprC